MDFFSFLMAFSVVVLLPIVIVKMTLDYKRERMAAGVSDEVAQESAITVGELKELVRDIVRESQADLAARVEALEDRALGDLDESDRITPGPAAERTVGRRTT